MHHSWDPSFSAGKLSSAQQDRVMDIVERVQIPSCLALDHLGHHILMQILYLQKNLSSRHADDDTSVAAVKVAS